MKLFRENSEIRTFDGLEGTIIKSRARKLVVETAGGGEYDVDPDDVVAIDGMLRPRPVYYQPRLTDEEWETGDLATFEVYRHYENAKKDYPDSIIDQFTGSDIEEHAFVDDADGRSRTYYVDVPNPYEGDDFTNVYTCFDREEAILFARLMYNADENGKINLISN